MLTAILSEPAFWTSFAIAIVISVAFTILEARAWSRKVAAATVTLSADALRSPIDSGITVSGLVLPLAISLIAYLSTQVGQGPHDLAVLFSSVAVIGLAVCVGVFNIYSMATVTKSDGTLEIKNDSLTYLPAQFVLQVLLLAWGLILLTVFCFFFLNVGGSQKAAAHPAQGIAVLRDPIKIGQSRDDVVASWGNPSAKSETPGAATWTYNTPVSTITLSLKEDKVTAIVERQKESP